MPKPSHAPWDARPCRGHSYEGGFERAIRTTFPTAGRAVTAGWHRYGRLIRPPPTAAGTPVVAGAEVGSPRITRTAR